MKYSMNKAFRAAYVLSGAVFAGVTVFMWLAGGWNRPAGDPLRTVYLVTAAAVFLLGVMLALRPFRACIKLEDDGSLFYCDGYLPGRRYELSRVRRVFTRGGKRVVLCFEDGRAEAVEFLFDGLESFLAEMRTRGIEVTDRDPRDARGRPSGP